MSDDAARSWLLIAVATGGSSTLRVHCWRKLRSLGALYIQSSVCLLPQTPETTRAVARLLDRVRREGGTGRMLQITINDPAEEASILNQFRAERADEYQEVCSRTPEFLKEIEMEQARGRATYTEVEESEADLERLRKWLGRVQARDYFGADGRNEAEQAVEACARALAEFEADALASELPFEQIDENTAQKPGRLHAVD